MPYNHSASLYDNYGQRKYLNTNERASFYKRVIALEDNRKITFLLTLYWAGLRISEALNLRGRNVDFDDHLLVVRCLKKRDKVLFRRVPIPPQLIKLLKSYDLSSEQRIFTWSRRTASRYVKDIMHESGITGPMACSKGLRHSFAVHCVTNNIPLSLLSRWLGHSHISTTTIYLDIIGIEEKQLAQRLWAAN